MLSLVHIFRHIFLILVHRLLKFNLRFYHVIVGFNYWSPVSANLFFCFTFSTTICTVLSSTLLPSYPGPPSGSPPPLQSVTGWRSCSSFPPPGHAPAISSSPPHATCFWQLSCPSSWWRGLGIRVARDGGTWCSKGKSGGGPGATG